MVALDVASCLFAVRSMCVVVLDELDQLLSRQQAVLYTLFELAADQDSRLILIGVANGLDLTERFLPRLAAKGASPQTLKFTPYGHAELCSIILQRIEEVEANEVMLRSRVQAAGGMMVDGAATTSTCQLIERQAAMFCAKKVAASSGDARCALEVRA